MKQINRSRGFSLILSLTVMAAVVMLVVTLSAFITIESRAAMNQQLAKRARLNSLVSMRLALAHLQQEAGADRRATARADITQPGVSTHNLKNPMWTGVWRTDKPDLPPAWLVSGRGDQPAGTQAVSLFESGTSADYPAGYWAPWQTPPNEAIRDMIDLVGLGSAQAAAGTRPSGIVSLPKVTLPDEDALGSYAYWIGDEGVKARINLADARSASASAADRLIALRSPAAAGLTGLKGLDTLTRPEQLGQIDTARQLALLAGFNSNAASDPDALASPEKTYFHDLSFVSAGVIADSFHGGLRRDLSLAFELSDNAFANTEFGQGRDLLLSPDGSAATNTEFGFAGRTLPKTTDDPMMMQIVTGDNGTTGASSSRSASTTAPVFSRTATNATPISGRTPQVRGPTWWALRDYHRLYQQVGWSAGIASGRETTLPELRARTFWPNAAVSRPSGNPEENGLPNNGIRNRAYSYSDIFDGNLPATLNPNAADVLNGNKGRLVTRPLHVAATPYVHRLSLAFSFTRSVEEIKSTKQEKNSLFLNVTPAVVIHNPYNVRMRWQPTTSGNSDDDAYPVAVCLSDMDGWNLILSQAGKSSYIKPISFFLRANGRTANIDDTFRVYVGGGGGDNSIVLEPGEFRVFSCRPVGANLPAITSWTQAVAATNQLAFGRALEIQEIINTEGGTFYDIDERNGFTAEISPGPALRMRHALDCWPGDTLLLSKDGSRPSDVQTWSFFLNSSEHSELVMTRGAMTPAGRLFGGISTIPFKFVDGSLSGPGPTNIPAPFAVVDITMKSADAARDPFPLFTHSNPLAASLRSSGAGRTATAQGNGINGSPGSYQLSVRPCSDWSEFIQQPDNQRAYGGYAVSSAKGSERVILTEIPLVQPVSLAQYAHANFGVRDQQPLLAVGNSFASPHLPAETVVFTQDGGRNWTEFDQSYLLNTALWDGFFLSSIAPQMKTAGTEATLPDHPSYKHDSGATDPAAPNIVKPLSSVVDDFVFNGTPLDNPRFSVERSGSSDEAIRSALSDYRRAASVLINQGAFNVNSSSVEAWTTFLGGAKQQALQGLGAEAPARDRNGRFVRTLSRLGTVAATENAQDRSNWQGFANLSDAQIRKLATAIVAENKERFGQSVRGERELRSPPSPRLFGGLSKPATPYLGLAEFINRFLCPETWANRCGALQAAIFRADADESAGLSDRLYAGLANIRLDRSSLTNASPEQFPFAANIEVGGGGRVHTALAAPGNLLQSDLLQTLGSALATRSDTFTLRCFGEAVLPGGETGVAWMEVVVQRTPEFIDRTNPAETGSSAPKPLAFGAPTSADPTTNRNLSPVNHILGRRFKIVSMRWLKTDEI